MRAQEPQIVILHDKTPISICRTGLQNVSASQLENAATLFSDNYGIWSRISPHTHSRAGQRVRMSPAYLKKAVMAADGSGSFYQALDIEGVVQGHLFTAHWDDVCWITQMVVHKDWRRKGIATELLRFAIRDYQERCNVFGILSSHPAALKALIRATDKDVDFERQRHLVEEGVLTRSSVPYVRDANVREGGKQAFTGFWVDHQEPEEVLRLLESEGKEWHFGALDDGCEYLLLVDMREAHQRES